MGSRRSTFTSSSGGIVTQETIVMFSKIFIFAIISVTIRGSLGMDTNDLLDILESRLEDDRQELGNSDLEAIRTLTEEDKMDRKLPTFNKFKPSLSGLSGLSLQLRRLGLNANDISTLIDMMEAERESNFLLAPIGLPLASAGKLEKIGGKLTLNPLLKKTGLAKEKLGKFLIIA